MASSHKSLTKSFILGATIGSAIGTLIGILYAPQEGDKTRKELQKGLAAGKKKAKGISQEVQEKAKEWSDTAQEKVGEVKKQAAEELSILREKQQPSPHKDKTTTTKKSQKTRPRRFRGV